MMGTCIIPRKKNKQTKSKQNARKLFHHPCTYRQMVNNKTHTSICEPGYSYNTKWIDKTNTFTKRLNINYLTTFQIAILLKEYQYFSVDGARKAYRELQILSILQIFR